MAELTASERLQPSLLDRLIDDEPDKKDEPLSRRVMSMVMLRRAVLRDLSNLLNCPSKPQFDEINEYPLAARSVLNYGMPDLTGLTASGVSPSRIVSMVRDAIHHYEPRIVGQTLDVRVVESAGSDGVRNGFAFEISGQLCPLPMPEALYVRTEIDLETGRFDIKERRA
ncbi:MAG: type VI secretion system baseplate subunit TssE [Phycisphaeraceae bacterium]|nr:type VI secretion system baseplate subunit TssE [Phycisphaerae bacterium]MBX3393079.1 type VI secretion system baseplate subunit TssE [Phycisphaeraceae bacterium]HRJ50610.1 type VI secretion system baseplate subunit TssE [Phycisphaerales bacterium]